MNQLNYILICLFLIVMSCNGQEGIPDEMSIATGAEQIDEYLPLLQNKRITIVANHTSLVGDTHLVDTLLSLNGEKAQIQKVLVPEHGFRGHFVAGELFDNEVDSITGLPLISLYGSHKKPFPEDLEDVDLVIFDIQDVGVRFFTYISTLHYVMEACAENNIPLLVLDRPNPNSGYIDGPILDMKHSTFIGMHPIPVVYGMTIGEFAQMINGEKWLENGVQCDLQVIPCLNYYHGKEYLLPVKPSPNLVNDHAIKLYPSTCFFEGTVVSEGRGTENPFEVFGHPEMEGDFSFTPKSIPGMSRYPKLEGKECFGMDLRHYQPEEGWNRIYLHWLVDAYHNFPDKDDFFIPFFEKLSGTDSLRKQIITGMSEEEIRQSWEKDLDEFKAKREKYLIY